MKKIKIFTLLIVSSLHLFFQQYPAPPASPNRLFYIQRSNNAHTVVYDANFINVKTFHAEQPVNVYWIRYDETTHTQKLNAVEKALVYGVEAERNAKEKNSFDVKIAALKRRILKVKINDSGKPIATMLISGIEGQLCKIFVQLESEDALKPTIRYIELFGKNLSTGKAIYEKFIP
ncbi:MAG: DUF4833 domain-containing protein [Emticicia sp.]|nr:DUF4833 domain-containing protein [Emticicia sp.]